MTLLHKGEDSLMAHLFLLGPFVALAAASGQYHSREMHRDVSFAPEKAHRMDSCDLRASAEGSGPAGTGLCCIRWPPWTLTDAVEAEPAACKSSSDSPFGLRSHLQKTHGQMSY